MILLNFSHPLTPDQVSQIETITGESVADVRHVPELRLMDSLYVAESTHLMVTVASNVLPPQSDSNADSAAVNDA